MSTGQRYWRGVSFAPQAATDTPVSSPPPYLPVCDLDRTGAALLDALGQIQQAALTQMATQRVVVVVDHTTTPATTTTTTTTYLADGGAICTTMQPVAWTHSWDSPAYPTPYRDPDGPARSRQLQSQGLTWDEQYAFTGLRAPATPQPVPAPVVRAILTATRERLTPPSAWNRGEWASTGGYTPPTREGDWDDPRYTRWCLVGAIRAEVNLWHRAQDQPPALTPWDVLVGTIQHLHQFLPSGGHAPAWNDQHTHADVVHLLAQAIRAIPAPAALPWTTWPGLVPAPRTWSAQDSGPPPFDQIVVPAPRIPDGDDPARARQSPPPPPTFDLPDALPDSVERILRRQHATPLPGFENV